MIIVGDGDDWKNDIDPILASVIQKRKHAKQNRDFALADAFRDEIGKRFGLAIEDSFVDGSLTSVYRNISEKEAEEKSDRHEKSIVFQLNQRQRQLSKRRPLISAEELATIARARKRLNSKCNSHSKKQKARFEGFSNWLMEHFNSVSHVLDVAGGQGSLCWHFVMKHNVKCTVVDPVSIRLSRQKTQNILQLVKETDAQNSVGLVKDTGILVENFLSCKSSASEEEKQIACNYFASRGGDQVRSLFNAEFQKKHLDLWKSVDLVVGLHPDQATDAIVDLSLESGTPFACVPCCVFPTLYSHRLLRDGTAVRSLEQLIQYLMEKSPDIKCEIVKTIPPPCNTVLYFNPET